MFFFSSYSILVGLEGKRNGRNGLNELEYGMESTACGNRPVRLHALKRDVTLRWLEEVRAIDRRRKPPRTRSLCLKKHPRREY